MVFTQPRLDGNHNWFMGNCIAAVYYVRASDLITIVILIMGEAAAADSDNHTSSSEALSLRARHAESLVPQAGAAAVAGSHLKPPPLRDNGNLERSEHKGHATAAQCCIRNRFHLHNCSPPRCCFPPSRRRLSAPRQRQLLQRNTRLNCRNCRLMRTEVARREP